MKIHCAKKDLEKGMLTVIKAVSNKTPLPILGHVKMVSEGEDNLILSTTDLEIAIEARVKVTVLEAGETTVPAKILAEILTQLPDRDLVMEIAEENQVMDLRCGNSRYDIHTLPAEDFPIISKPEGEEFIELPQKFLRQLIRNVVIAAASEEETRTVLTGVMMVIEPEHILLATTDGRRLAKAEREMETGVKEKRKMIIPARAISELSRSLQETDQPVRLTIGENKIFFSLDSVLIMSRLMEGQFPDYEQIIPKSFNHTLSVKREELLSSLRRVLIMAQEKDIPRLIKMKMEKDKMILTSNTPELGQGYEEIPIESDISNLQIAFNGKYILDALTSLEEGDIEIMVSSPISPGLIRGKGDEVFIYLIMPVRLREEALQEA